MSKQSITNLIKNVVLTEGCGDFADYGIPAEVDDADRYNWKLNIHSDTSLEFIPFQGSDLEMEMGKGNDEFDIYRLGGSENGEQIHDDGKLSAKRAAMKESIMESVIGSLDELLKAAKEMGKAPKPTFTNSPGIVSTMDLIKSLNGVRLPVKTSEVWAVNGYNDHGVKTTTFYTRTGKGPNDFRIKEITDRKHFKK